LALSGPVTTVPVLFFGAAARRLRLSTMGFLQYLAPTLQFSLAVMVFGEPFSKAQIASFACIWTAIAIYTADSFHAARQARLYVEEPG
jgi:chloramphenicol-sensitive protein RarD